MEVNFNNLRVQALNSYEKLVYKLNSSIIRNDDQYAELPNGRMENLEGYVVIDSGSIQKVLDELRMELVAISSVYEPGDDKFADVLPDRKIISFNNTDGE